MRSTASSSRCCSDIVLSPLPWKLPYYDRTGPRKGRAGTAVDADELHALALSRPADALRIARDVLAGTPSDADAAAAHHAAGLVHRDFGDIREAVAELNAAYRSIRRTT